MGEQQYWAQAPSDEIGGKIRSKVDQFDRYFSESGRLRLCQRMTNMYYGLDAEGGWAKSSAVTFGGDQGELTLLRVNHLRSVVDQRVNQVTGQRPSFEAMATNTDYEAGEQAALARKVFDYHLTKQGLEEQTNDAVKRCALTAEGAISLTWDVNGGELYGIDPVTNRSVYTGAPVYRCYSSYDVIRDPDRIDMDFDWLATRRLINKWDLIAQYPEHKDKLMALGADTSRFPNSPYRHMTFAQRGGSQSGSDLVEVVDWYHRKTLAVPDGRIVTMSGGDVVLFDGPLPYDEIPVYILYEDNESNTPFGHSKNWDIIAPQQGLDSCVSTIATNHDAFGVQNIMVPQGSGFNVEDLSGGVRLMYYNAQMGKPEPMNLLQTSDQSYKLHDLFRESIEMISGANATSRGNPGTNLKSGSALALVQSMSVQSNSGLASAYVRFLEKLGTALIRRYQYFATTPHLVEIVGIDKRAAVETFTGQDLNKVRRITVSLGGPLMRTQSGRLEVANDLAERWPQEVTPEQYMQVLETGRLEPIYETPTKEPQYIKLENELLMNGQDPNVIYYEDHPLHIQEHRTLSFDMSIRQNDELMRVILGHIQKHVDYERALSGDVAMPSSQLQAAGANKISTGPGIGPVPDKGQAPVAKVPGAEHQNTSGIKNDMPLMPVNPSSGTRTSPTGNNAGPQ